MAGLSESLLAEIERGALQSPMFHQQTTSKTCPHCPQFVRTAGGSRSGSHGAEGFQADGCQRGCHGKRRLPGGRLPARLPRKTGGVSGRVSEHVSQREEFPNGFRNSFHAPFPLCWTAISGRIPERVSQQFPRTLPTVPTRSTPGAPGHDPDQVEHDRRGRVLPGLPSPAGADDRENLEFSGGGG